MEEDLVSPCCNAYNASCCIIFLFSTEARGCDLKLYNKSDRAIERIEENHHFMAVEKKQDGNQEVAVPNWHPGVISAYFLDICAKDDLCAASQQKQPDLLPASNQDQLSASNQNQLSASNQNQLSACNQNQLSASNKGHLSASNQNQLSASNKNQLSASNQNPLSASNQNQLSDSNQDQLSASTQEQRDSSSASGQDQLYMPN